MAVRAAVKLVDGVKNIIAVASRKGGVGKSTNGGNLHWPWQQKARSVGMLDATFTGLHNP